MNKSLCVLFFCSVCLHFVFMFRTVLSCLSVRVCLFCVWEKNDFVLHFQHTKHFRGVKENEERKQKWKVRKDKQTFVYSSGYGVVIFCAGMTGVAELLTLVVGDFPTAFVPFVTVLSIFWYYYLRCKVEKNEKKILWTKLKHLACEELGVLKKNW